MPGWQLIQRVKGGTTMALLPWRPFEELSTLRQEMDRLLERFFGEPLGAERPASMWAPRMDVAETKDRVTIKAEFPGLEAKQKAIPVTVE